MKVCSRFHSHSSISKRKNQIGYSIGVSVGGRRSAGSRIRMRPSVSTACPMPKLKNGTVRMQRGGRMGYFFCANGFDIHGPMNIVCQMGRWKQEIPKCLSKCQ